MFKLHFIQSFIVRQIEKYKERKRRKLEEEKRKRFNEGYLWALNAYFIEKLTLKKIEEYYLLALDFGAKDEFDRGVKEFLRNYSLLESFGEIK